MSYVVVSEMFENFEINIKTTKLYKLIGLYNVDTFKSLGSDSFVTHLRHLCLTDSEVTFLKLVVLNIKTPFNEKKAPGYLRYYLTVKGMF